jgi:hypothetical protein
LLLRFSGISWAAEPYFGDSHAEAFQIIGRPTLGICARLLATEPSLFSRAAPPRLIDWCSLNTHEYPRLRTLFGSGF